MPGLWEVISASMNLGAEKKGFCKPAIRQRQQRRPWPQLVLQHKDLFQASRLFCVVSLWTTSLLPSRWNSVNLQVLLPDPPEAFMTSGFLVDQGARH